MFVKLLPDQVASFWDVIKYSIEQALPPVVGDNSYKMNSILSAALCDKLDVWVSFEVKDGNKVINGVVTTRIAVDEISETKNLLMYTVYGYSENKVNYSYYKEGMEAMARYAKSRGCSKIIAFTTIPYMVELSKKLGCNTDYTLVSYNLDNLNL